MRRTALGVRPLAFGPGPRAPKPPKEMKTILFVCVHNAGRSQMAEAMLNRLASDRGLDVRGISAGTLGGAEINPVAVQVMDEAGISMSGQQPKLLTQVMVDQADQIITMGCDVDADACPAKFLVTEDWGLDDPKGKAVDEVRRIRDEIKAHVLGLLDEAALA